MAPRQKAKAAVSKEAVLSTLRVHDAVVHKCAEALGITHHQFMYHVRIYDLIGDMDDIVETKRRMIMDKADHYMSKCLDADSKFQCDKFRLEACRVAYYNYMKKDKLGSDDAVNLEKLAQELGDED